jgi:hypothetical protein
VFHSSIEGLLAPASEFLLTSVKMKRQTDQKQENSFHNVMILDYETFLKHQDTLSVFKKQTGPTQRKRNQGKS